MLANGETVIELLTRSKYLLSVSGEKWTDRQKTRAKILFKMFPKIKEAYTLICSLRSVFSNKPIDRVTAKVKLHEWYQKVSACTLREVKAARDAIKYKEDEVQNYFINRSTNAHAESLNSKLKGFRAQLRGVQDLPFFMFKASMTLWITRLYCHGLMQLCRIGSTTNLQVDFANASDQCYTNVREHGLFSAPSTAIPQTAFRP